MLKKKAYIEFEYDRVSASLFLLPIYVFSFNKMEPGPELRTAVPSVYISMSSGERSERERKICLNNNCVQQLQVKCMVCNLKQLPSDSVLCTCSLFHAGKLS